MPIIKSAKKALRQSFRRQARNTKRKDRIKDLVKKVRTLVSQKKTGEAKKLLPEIYQALDKGAKTGVIKKNNASRKKARLAKLLNKD